MLSYNITVAHSPSFHNVTVGNRGSGFQIVVDGRILLLNTWSAGLRKSDHRIANFIGDLQPQISESRDKNNGEVS